MQLTIFWGLIILLFIWLVKTNGDKYIKKLIGSFLIIAGLFIFSPLPSIDDIILLPIFASAMGNDLTIEGIKQTFLPYSIVTAIIGLVIAYVGIWVSGLKLKDLKNRIRTSWKKII